MGDECQKNDNGPWEEQEDSCEIQGSVDQTIQHVLQVTIVLPGLSPQALELCFHDDWK
jgi:hypothetical protein